MPINMAIIQKIKNYDSERGCGEIGTFAHRWWECKMVLLLWETA